MLSAKELIQEYVKKTLEKISVSEESILLLSTLNKVDIKSFLQNAFADTIRKESREISQLTLKLSQKAHELDVNQQNQSFYLKKIEELRTISAKKPNIDSKDVIEENFKLQFKYESERKNLIATLDSLTVLKQEKERNLPMLQEFQKLALTEQFLSDIQSLQKIPVKKESNINTNLLRTDMPTLQINNTDTSWFDRPISILSVSHSIISSTASSTSDDDHYTSAKTQHTKAAKNEIITL